MHDPKLDKFVKAKYKKEVELIDWILSQCTKETYFETIKVNCLPRYTHHILASGLHIYIESGYIMSPSLYKSVDERELFKDEKGRFTKKRLEHVPGHVVIAPRPYSKKALTENVQSIDVDTQPHVIYTPEFYDDECTFPGYTDGYVVYSGTFSNRKIEAGVWHTMEKYVKKNPEFEWLLRGVAGAEDGKYLAQDLQEGICRETIDEELLQKYLELKEMIDVEIASMEEAKKLGKGASINAWWDEISDVYRCAVNDLRSKKRISEKLAAGEHAGNIPNWKAVVDAFAEFDEEDIQMMCTIFGEGNNKQ